MKRVYIRGILTVAVVVLAVVGAALFTFTPKSSAATATAKGAPDCYMLYTYSLRKWKSTYTFVTYNTPGVTDYNIYVVFNNGTHVGYHSTTNPIVRTYRRDKDYVDASIFYNHGNYLYCGRYNF